VTVWRVYSLGRVPSLLTASRAQAALASKLLWLKRNCGRRPAQALAEGVIPRTRPRVEPNSPNEHACATCDLGRKRSKSHRRVGLFRLTSNRGVREGVLLTRRARRAKRDVAHLGRRTAGRHRGHGVPEDDGRIGVERAVHGDVAVSRRQSQRRSSAAPWPW
jgi:hypothetical protein